MKDQHRGRFRDNPHRRESDRRSPYADRGGAAKPFRGRVEAGRIRWRAWRPIGRTARRPRPKARWPPRKPATRRAARINAAVAGVDAAGAAVAAAKVAADFTGAKVPPVVSEIEEANANAHVSIFWQVIPYILTTIAEVCISVVGLELAFAAAPPALKTFMTACWLFTIFFANIINAQVSPLYNDTFLGISLTPDWYFLWFAVAMVPVTLAFVYVSHRFNRPATA